MAERLRTEGVGRGVNWAGMSNLANIIQRGGETQAEIYKGIGETIGRKIRDQQELSLEREKLSQQSGIQARQMALQEAQYGLDLQKYQFDVARADTEISNKVSTDKLNSLVKLAEQARESGDQQLWQRVTRQITNDLSMGPVDEANAVMGLDSGAMGPFLSEEEASQVGVSPEVASQAETWKSQASSAPPEQIPVLQSAFKSWLENISNEYNDARNRSGQVLAGNTNWNDKKSAVSRELQLRERKARANYLASQAAGVEVNRVFTAAQQTARSQQITQLINRPDIDGDMRAALTMVKPWIESGTIDPEEGMRLAMRSVSEARMSRTAEANRAAQEPKIVKESIPAAIRKIDSEARGKLAQMLKSAELDTINRKADKNNKEFNEAVDLAVSNISMDDLMVVVNDPMATPIMRDIARSALIKEYKSDKNALEVLKNRNLNWSAYRLQRDAESYGHTPEAVAAWIEDQSVESADDFEEQVKNARARMGK